MRVLLPFLSFRIPEHCLFESVKLRCTVVYGVLEIFIYKLCS